jgi:hypothetical protein
VSEPQRAGCDQVWYLREGGYPCPICQSALSSRSNLKLHIEAVHRLSPDDFEAEHGELPQVAAATFICKICDTACPWEPRTIKRHLENTHFLSLEKYGEIYLGAVPRDTPSRRTAGSSSRNTSLSDPVGSSLTSRLIKPVEVSVAKLRSDLYIRSSSEAAGGSPSNLSSSLLSVGRADCDYSALSKVDLGRRLNSAIESYFLDVTESPASSSCNPAQQDAAWREQLDDQFPVRRKCSSCLYATTNRDNLAR